MYLSRLGCVFVTIVISNSHDCQAYLSSWFQGIEGAVFHGAKGNMQERSKGGQHSYKHQCSVGLSEVLNNFKVCETVKEEECQDQLVKRYQVKLNSKIVSPLTHSYFPGSI